MVIKLLMILAQTYSAMVVDLHEFRIFPIGSMFLLWNKIAMHVLLYNISQNQPVTHARLHVNLFYVDFIHLGL